MPRYLLILLSGAAMLLAATVHAAPLNVRLILSDRLPAYLQFSGSFNEYLANKRGISVSENIEEAQPDLIVAVGMKATEFAITHSTAPVLGAMIPKAGYETLLERYAAHYRSRPFSAIYIEQPLGRQLDFIKAALPEYRRLGVLYSPGASMDLQALGSAGAERGFALVTQPVEGNLFPSLDEVLSRSDLLLATPDSVIYNSSNVRNILLASYRRKVPLIGLSQAYLNAGALCAIFSTPEQIAVQTGAAVAAFAMSRQLPEPRYPASFNIGLNQQVARSLGIILDTPEQIRERMGKTSRGAK